MSVNLYDLNIICHVCLEKSSQMTNLQETGEKSRILRYFFVEVSGIEYKPHDGYYNICTTCEGQAYAAYAFRELCRKSAGIIKKQHLQKAIKDEIIDELDAPISTQIKGGDGCALDNSTAQHRTHDSRVYYRQHDDSTSSVGSKTGCCSCKCREDFDYYMPSFRDVVDSSEPNDDVDCSGCKQECTPSADINCSCFTCSCSDDDCDDDCCIM